MILYRPGRWFVTRPCEQIVGLRDRIVHEYAEVDTEPGEKMQRLIAQTREQTKRARTLDDAFAWNLEELGYGV